MKEHICNLDCILISPPPAHTTSLGSRGHCLDCSFLIFSLWKHVHLSMVETESHMSFLCGLGFFKTIDQCGSIKTILGQPGQSRRAITALELPVASAKAVTGTASQLNFSLSLLLLPSLPLVLIPRHSSINIIHINLVLKLAPGGPSLQQGNCKFSRED